jgi:hypothetical protein
MIAPRNVWKAMAPRNRWMNAYLIYFTGIFTVDASPNKETEPPGNKCWDRGRVWVGGTAETSMAYHPVDIGYLEKEMALR